MKVRTKKLLFICTFLGLFNSLSVAQGREFGIRAGLLAAGTYNDGEQVDDFTGGLYLGVFLGRPVGSTFFTSWITGLDYFQNGYRTDAQNYRMLHYLGVPMAFRFHFGPFYLQPGTSLNFKVAEKLLVDGEEVLSYVSNSYRFDIKSSRFDLPIMLAAGVRVMDVILEARYYYGWMDINQGNKNMHLHLGLAYSF